MAHVNFSGNGLRVSSSVTNNRTAESATTTAAATSFAVVGGASSEKERHEQPVRSSLRTETSTPTRHRVTLSPEVEKKLASGEKDTRLTRTSARKSRLTDSFFDAKERLEDAREAAASSRASPMATRTNRPRAYLRPALDPENTVMVFPDDDLTPMGIEVTGVQDDPSSSNGRLSAVQILRIEPDGRVGMDGRLKVGDNIIEIDSRPVYQMSIVRARAYLSELQSRSEPSLTIARPPSSFTDPVDPLSRNQPTTSSLQNRPILSALQQANTQHIGHTKIVELRKTPAGFGFTVTGRETAKGERLFYIGTVKPNGVALGHLRAGDRLLEINGEPTAELTQAEVVDRLKKAGVGEAVTFLVSRVIPQEEEDEKKSSSSERENRPPSPTAAVVKRESEDSKATTSASTVTIPSNPDVEELELVIPLNDTGSAGLGVSLKARVTVRTNGTRQDCGIFIKNVLHGGAAHKDGRLRVNDRIVGIEELRLDGESNATASEAVSRRLKAIGPTAKHVRLFIQRARTFEGRRSASQPQEVSRVSVDSEGPSRISVVATESTSSEEKPSPMEGLDSDFGRLDESEMANVSDPFSREAPTRKSMSEKRGMGASNDPHHIKLFQDIKHQRQTSAPLSAMTTSLSFHGQTTGRSASQRAAARARSQSVHPRAPAPPKIMKMTPTLAPVPPQQHHSAPAASEKRRSQSVESISQDSRATPKTKRAAMPYRGALTSDSFRQATDFYSETVYSEFFFQMFGHTAPPPHPFPPGSPVMLTAPLSAMTTSLSFHGQTTGRSASQRAAARARSQSVHPRAPAPPKIMKMTPTPAPLPPQQHHSAPAASEKRRSQSVESISQDSRATPKTKRAAMPYRGALTSDSFRQATDFYSETVYSHSAPPPPPHPFPPGSPVMVKQRSASRDKDKQRRKSLGGLNVMKSFLGFGSGKSREESPSQKTDAKAEETQRLREEEEKKRIREHYERLREKEAEANRHPHSLTPGTARREGHRMYDSPNYNYPPQFTTTPSPSTDPPLIVANSRFYFSLRASLPPLCYAERFHPSTYPISFVLSMHVVFVT
ncbi:PDZ/DHR/GLGF domain protein [Ancylostoma caninum]|uniref:PDZ/DHR/GLGF domain protein n=1 Tax=Ancylostoma caninum TaxID=29170 RepID=A0A368H3Q2_ANCCA|nr:PDZ/DHR/GLGF domain protein [Ancylostoma caninum]